MREVITVHVGQAGNAIGGKFWEMTLNEHGLDTEGIYRGSSFLQRQRLHVYFNESSTGRYVPRTVLADLEANTLDMIRLSAIGNIFRPDSFITGEEGAHNNYAKGFHSGQVFEDVFDAIRKEAEHAEHIQGFQVIHALGGGTGSGLGALIMCQLTEDFKERIRVSYNIVPSPKVSEVVTEPYNAVLALSKLIDLTNLVFVLDNEALYKICCNVLRLVQPTYGDFNHLVALAMSGVTTCLRFPGQLNADLRKIEVNMVPFPRIQFCMTGFAPLSAVESAVYKPMSVADLTQQVFSSSNLMVASNPLHGKYMTVVAMFRGKLSMREVEECMVNYKIKNDQLFADWIPNNVKCAVCDIAPHGFKKCVTFAANNTAIVELFQRLLDQYRKMYKKKAFLHWYENSGLETKEFEEALNNLEDLKNTYNFNGKRTSFKGETDDSEQSEEDESWKSESL